MANQNNSGKQKLNIWMDKALVAQIDGVAAKKGMSRAAVVSEAVRRYVDDGDGPATKADILALAATLTKAIESQPIAVQQALPSVRDEQPRRLTLRERIRGVADPITPEGCSNG